MTRAIKPGADLNFSVLVRPLRTRVILGNRSLVFTEYVDPEPFLGVQMSVGSRGVIHTHQHQHGIERNRGKRVRGHSVDFAIEVNCDDCDACGKGPHRFAEVCLV